MRVLLPLRAVVRRAAAAVAAAAAAEQPAAGDGDARHLLPDARAARRRAGDGLLRNASVERSGCYLFHRLEAPRAGELDGSAAAASFVLTTTLTPSHNSSILRQQKVYAQLEHVLTTRTVYLVETQHGWRSCCKTNCVSNATLEYDLWDAYTNIFEFATRRYPGRSVVVFEDDFFWSDKASAKLRDVAPFIAANASRHGHYFLGMIPFPGTMKPLTSDEKHWSVSNGGACHAVVHTPRGMATIIERYRGDPCLASMYTRPASPGGSEDEWCRGGKCGRRTTWASTLSSPATTLPRTEPLAFQLFPATENRARAIGKVPAQEFRFSTATRTRASSTRRTQRRSWAEYAEQRSQANWELTGMPSRAMEPHSERGRRVI